MALDKPSFGISSGDVLTELNCFRVMGRVLSSLALDNGKKFSLLPLVEFELPRADDANMSEVAIELQTFALHILLLALSEITFTFFTFLLIVLPVLCFIWLQF